MEVLVILVSLALALGLLGLSLVSLVGQERPVTMTLRVRAGRRSRATSQLGMSSGKRRYSEVSNGMTNRPANAVTMPTGCI